MSTPQTPTPDAWGQAQKEMQSTPTSPATPTPTDAWGQAQAEMNAQQAPPQGRGATPQQTGEITNDVGQKVIVPKDGESFQDTMRRAVQYHQSLTPEQQKAAISAETETIPKKAAQTIAAAPAIGFGGTAALAAPGEVINVAKMSPEALEAIQEMAKDHPDAAKFIKKVLTGAIAGHSMGHTATGAGLGLLWDLLP